MFSAKTIVITIFNFHFAEIPHNKWITVSESSMKLIRVKVFLFEGNTPMKQITRQIKAQFKNCPFSYLSLRTLLRTSHGGASTSTLHFHSLSGWPSPTFLYATSVGVLVGTVTHPLNLSRDSCEQAIAVQH